MPYRAVMGKKVKIGKVKVKEKCCVSKTRCSSCPIRLLKEGRLPEGYAVHKRRLVTVETKKSAKAKDKHKGKDRLRAAA